MGADTGAQDRRERFNDLLLAGKQAYEAGDRRAAHDRWRAAAAIDPYNEKVWTALLRVLDDEDDRRVCLENIIAINPMNVQARRLLYKQNPEAAAAPANAAATETVTEPKRPVSGKGGSKKKTTTQTRAASRQDTKPVPKVKRRTSVGRLLLMVIVALVVAILLALVLAVVIFGRR